MQQYIIQYINEVLSVTDTNYFLINQFGDTKNQPMRTRNIEPLISNIGKRIHRPDLHPHMFRHGLAVNMLSNGCSMIQTKDTLRHKNIETTIIKENYINQQAISIIPNLIDEIYELTDTRTKFNRDIWHLEDYNISAERMNL